LTAQQEADALDERIREAHGVLKDLRREMREAKRIGPALAKAAVSEAVGKEIATLGVETRKAMDIAVDKVQQEFDRLTELLFGKRARRGYTLPEYIEHLDYVTRDDDIARRYYDLFRAGDRDDFTFAIEHARLDHSRGFSEEALEDLRGLLFLFVCARLAARWSADGEAPAVLSVRVHVDLA
jgi:hypothetical protein